MQNTFTLEGTQIKIWDYRGFVDSVQFRSQTHVWNSGGGGFIHPQHGGYVRAPNIHSQVVNTKEVRFTFSDNNRETITLAGHMTFDTNDDVSLFYACEAGQPRGSLVGVANHTEGKYWSLDAPRSLRRPTSKTVKRLWLATLISIALAWLCAHLAQNIGSLDYGRDFREYSAAQARAQTEWQRYQKEHNAQMWQFASWFFFLLSS